jgi:hypothetical protein
MTQFIFKSSDPDQAPRWRSKPIPWLMSIRGFLPKFLGGEMVYDAVVRTNHFGSPLLLTDYLMEQWSVAIHRDADFHVAAIRAHVQALIDSGKTTPKTPQKEPSP